MKSLKFLINFYTKKIVFTKREPSKIEKLKISFLNCISHEIRTPVNAIVGFSRLLINNQLSECNKKEYNKYIIDSAFSLLHKIDNIIDMSMILSGQVKIQKCECKINEMLDNLVIKTNEKKIKLNKEDIKVILIKPFQHNNDILIYTDQIWLTKILDNLLDNALKFTKKGFIKFGYFFVGQKNSYLQFFVEDTGIGIPKNHQNNIFNRFVKIESRSELYGGLGLGLPISKNITHLLGGKMWAISIVEKGSIFYFTLPV